MKAVCFEAPGNPATVLSVRETERPRPGRDEVLVRMLASPVNPSDLMYVRGRYTVPAQCPATPGFEGVGIVEASGGGLKGRIFQGRRVVVLNKKGGNWADYAVVPSSQVIPVSSRLSMEQAATFFVNPATAWVMTREVLKVPAGAWLLQTAAGSALGHMIVRLGRQHGFRTFNVVRRAASVDALKAQGADHVEVFDETSDPDALLSKISAVVGSDGLKYAVDAVGGLTGSTVVRSLGLNGRMLAYGTLSNQPLQFSPRTLMTVESRVEGFWLGNFMNQTGLLARLSLVRTLTNLIQSGVLKTEIAAKYAPDQIATAVAAAEDSAVTGKVLLQMSEP